jgi:hypothetical protein
MNIQALANSNGDWLCELPEHFEWVLPAGKITPVIGDPIYVSGHGEHLSRAEYIAKYNIDPELAYQLMRRQLPAIAYRLVQGSAEEYTRTPQSRRSRILFDDESLESRL